MGYDDFGLSTSPTLTTIRADLEAELVAPLQFLHRLGKSQAKFANRIDIHGIVLCNGFIS